MKPTTLLTLSATTLALCGSLVPTTVSAKESFVQRIPNGANVPGVKAIGHTDGTGDKSAENAFGKAFDKAGLKWTTALCQADTDGDGQTNGQELGDPCCEWTQGSTPRYTEGVSHPSDINKKADPALWASITCPAAATGTSSPATGQGITPVVVVVGLAAGVAAGAAAFGLM